MMGESAGQGFVVYSEQSDPLQSPHVWVQLITFSGARYDPLEVVV